MFFKNVKQIAGWRLCIGCGACAYACPEKKISLVDILDQGIRPELKNDECGSCDMCVKACPGYETAHIRRNEKDSSSADLLKGWGPVLELWEGYASDPEIRYSGSSGGLASALALYCMEKQGMAGVLHVGIETGVRWKNKTVLSKNRAELLERTGSRYSPASPCDSLEQIEIAPLASVFIGKGCDVAGLRKAQQLRPKLAVNTGVAIGIFCAGAPATKGTLDLLTKLGVDPKMMKEVRYRGKGWPGKFTVQLREEESAVHSLPYMEAWGFLQRYRPFRCYLCPDGTSEFADISCGDPWYRKVEDGDAGYSLALIRTEKGREIFKNAMDAGYISMQRVAPKILEESQKNLLEKRKEIWGRLLALKLFAIPVPRLQGFHLLENWLELPISEKARSVLGTVRRIVQRKYYKPMQYNVENS